MVLKISQCKLIKKEDYEASLMEVKAENTVLGAPEVKLLQEQPCDNLNAIGVKPEIKNVEFDRKYIIVDPVLKEKMKEHCLNENADEQESVNYICQTCKKEFCTLSEYEDHVISHAVENHTCSFCGKTFKNISTVRKHENSHKGIRFPCSYCLKELASKQQLDAHIRRHTGTYTHKCDECGKEYYNNKAFRQHIEAEHKGIRYTCVICGSVLKSRRYWKDHMAKHTSKNIKRYLCEICLKFYSSKAALNGHIKIHTEERYECNICGKKSTQKAAHLVHMRLHTGEKEFVCEICGKDFVRKDMMQIHKRRVHEARKHCCQFCQHEFKTERQLLIHFHTHEEVEKKFSCEFCNKMFINVNFLRNHINKIHVEKNSDDVNSLEYFPTKNLHNKKVKCVYCNKLVSKSNLKSHQDTHNIKTKTINKCPSNLTAPKIHNSQHELVENCSCSICFEKFDDSESYHSHIHNVHNTDTVISEAIIYGTKDDMISSDAIMDVCITDERITF